MESAQYEGPERRTLPNDFHDRLAVLLREVTAAEVAKAVKPMADEVARVRRVIEGENGGSIFSQGVVGAMEKVIKTDEAHDRRLTDLEQKWDRFKWTVTGAALGGGFGGGILSTWLFSLIDKAVP